MSFTVNPSAFEAIIEGTTNADYPEGCLRYQSVKHLVKAARERLPLHPIYAAIGTIAEEFVASEIGESEFVTREAVVIVDLGDDVSVSGRADYLLPDSVIEVKATVSSSKRALWRKGQMVPTHIGQLMSYMLFTDRNRGVLKAFYMHFEREGAALGLEPFMYVIDGMTPAREAEVMSYYKAVKYAMIGSDLPPRPLTLKPCQTCAFKAVCDLDLKSKSDFVEEVNVVLARPALVVSGWDPRIKRHARK